MSAASSPKSVLFVHSLAPGDEILSATLKKIDEDGSSVEVVAVSAANPVEGVPAFAAPFDVVQSVLSSGSDVLPAFFAHVLSVLKPGGKYIHGLQVCSWHFAHGRYCMRRFSLLTLPSCFSWVGCAPRRNQPRAHASWLHKLGGGK